jgi:3-isopropylmalate/(R)-2-methylmalate dehydratase large subunit
MTPAIPIEGARLLPGVTPADLEARFPAQLSADASSISAQPQADRVIRGRALIFWDPKDSTRKRDAIDTDQITPTTDCVSESLEALDERWKAGAFRHVMADFRERVHRGETFLIAGDRFAIGSSREMSPAGLKGIAEEVGLEMVIVCGSNMGDIFRRNAFNLGLHVVQAPEAVADAQDGHELAFDPSTRALRNLTLNTIYTPLALSPKEEEIRSSGGIFAVGRRELARSIAQPPSIEWADPAVARRLSTTQQILWSHRADKTAHVEPGQTLRVYGDLFPASDGTGPFAIHTFNQITGGDSIYPRRAAIANDHFVFTGFESDDKQTAISRDFAAHYGIGKPHYATPGDGIFHFYFPEQGLIVPGGFYPGADSHSRAYGAYGAIGIGVGSTTLGFGWATGAIYVTVPKQRRVRITGRLQPWVTGKDIVLALLKRWGAAQAQGMSVELVDVEGQLPMVYRNTIANMMAEAEAFNGVFAQDAITTAWFAERGFTLPYPQVGAGADVDWAIDEELSLDAICPQIAKPFSPSNALAAGEVAQERITFDKAMIGSCTNGSYDDLLHAALVIDAASKQGASQVARGVELVVFPGSQAVRQRIELGEPRLGGRSVAEVLRSVGGQIRQSWCGPCFGQGPDALGPGQRAITTFNRNWQNRMGLGGEGYLASPAVVAASALAGFMAGPDALGVVWDAQVFGA